MSKKSKVNYTNRDYDSIRDQLIEYARKYYPDTFQDFNDASFGMLMLELVSLVGDELSFYLDYQASESFIDSAIEYNNVLRLARQKGYKAALTPTSQGIQSFYITVPANNSGGGPNEDYLPILKKGSEFSSTNGNVFTLTTDVDFNDDNSEFVLAETDPNTNLPLRYAVKNFGRVLSGELISEEFDVGEFEEFKRIYLERDNVAEIVSVYDAQGRQYYEVDNLSQDVIYKSIRNASNDSNEPNFLKPFAVARRFTVERDDRGVYMQFGHGSDEDLDYIDPTNLTLDMTGRNYISDTSFDPSNLVKSDKFGVAPENTTLIVTYRINRAATANASVGTITQVNTSEFKFRNQSQLSTATMRTVIESLETNNEQPIVGDVSVPSANELKIRAKNHFATQKRAVTLKDYESLCYAMPNEFGLIKRANAVKGDDNFGRNIDIYVAGENTQGHLITTNQTIKRNLKTWINEHRVVNDTINIRDPFIVNIGIEFDAISEDGFNKFEVQQRILNTVINEFASTKMEIGQPILLSELYNMINEVEGVEDVADVRAVKKQGSLYSSVRFNIEDNLSADGRFIKGYDNIIFEIKYPEDDIVGNIV